MQIKISYLPFRRLDLKVLNFLHCVDPLLRNIRLDVRVLNSNLAKTLMDSIGGRVKVLYFDFDGAFADTYDKYSHVLTNIMIVHVVFEIDMVSFVFIIHFYILRT